ncbi:MAG: tetratricopeptide repeat protein, partial [Chthonomonadales bacterium]
MSQKSSPKLLFILGGIVIVFGLLARLYYFQTNKPVKPAVVNPAELATTAHFIALVDRVKANPNDVQAHKNLAAFFMDQKVFEKAAREYDFVIKRDARDDVSRGKLAEVFLAAKKYDAAESIYTDLTVRIPKQLSAWQGLTATLIKEGRYLEAMHVVRKALTLEPDNPSTHLLMAKSALEYAVQFPNPENHAGELDFARKEFEGLVKAFPDNAEIQYNLGRAYVALHNKKNGIAALERAHQMVPKNQEFGQMLVIVLRAMNNQARALTITR